MKPMCWLELVDCSVLANCKLISGILREMAYEDTEVLVEGPEWNEDMNMLDRFSALYWNSLPGLSDGFKALADVLNPGEYLVFEEKARYGFRANSTLRITRVAKDSVEHVTGDDLLRVFSNQVPVK